MAVARTNEITAKPPPKTGSGKAGNLKGWAKPTEGHRAAPPSQGATSHANRGGVTHDGNCDNQTNPCSSIYLTGAGGVGLPNFAALIATLGCTLVSLKRDRPSSQVSFHWNGILTPLTSR